MSQISSLPQMKKISLTPDQLKPPPGSKPVGVADDGRVIWEGPVFAGSPYFQQNAVSDDGHGKTPMLDPVTGEQLYRKNKATGEKITPRFHAKRQFVTRQFVMTDMGNGNAGPRPVPGLSDEEKSRREKQALVDSYMERLSRAAVEEGLTPDELVASVLAGRKSAVPGEVETATSTVEEVEPEDDRVPAVQPRNVAGQDEDPTVAAVTPKKKATRKKRAPKGS